MKRLACPICPFTLAVIPLILVVSVVGALQEQPPALPTTSRPTAASPTPIAPATADRLLDGREKSLVVVGYSTSYAWPTMLQDMLDEHAEGQRTYHVLNAVIGGSPTNRWIAEPGSREYKATFGAMLRDYFGNEPRLRGDAPPPTIAICQQSLQRTRAVKGPVTSANDQEGIRLGADALEKLALQLQRAGAEKVYIAMHIYKHGYEPQVGNERFALRALLDRGHDFILAGPDVWSRTIGAHPDAFADDGLHPNDRGMKIMAEAWYRTLAGDEARPDIIERMHNRAYDTDAITREYLGSRRAP
jgi:hypothetical protein